MNYKNYLSYSKLIVFILNLKNLIYKQLNKNLNLNEF